MTRAVANAEMKFFGTSERGNTALSELNELIKKSILMVQQFLKLYIMESLILAQNERWRRG